VEESIWIPPIRRTVATEGNGIPELAEAIAAHSLHLHQGGDWARRERARLESELEALIQDSLTAQFRANVTQERYNEILAQVIGREISPWEATRILLNGRHP
jgi:LAO/AO transport system kinase